MYLRELPEPVVPFENFGPLIATIERKFDFSVKMYFLVQDVLHCRSLRQMLEKPGRLNFVTNLKSRYYSIWGALLVTSFETGFFKVHMKRFFLL